MKRAIRVLGKQNDGRFEVSGLQVIYDAGGTEQDDLMVITNLLAISATVGDNNMFDYTFPITL